MPRSLRSFALTRDLTPSLARQRFGEPDRDIGSGLMIYEYRLDDGTTLLLGFPGEALILYAKRQQPDGGTSDLPLR